MYEKPPTVFLVSFRVLYSNIMLSAVMITISLVFSVGSVVFPASSLSRDRWVILRRVRCMVVVLVLASAFLHVKVSVKVVRVFLGNVTSFWSTFVLGGGNVTCHGIQVPRERLSLISALHLRAPVRYDVACCQGILGDMFAGFPARSYRERA